MFSDQSRDIMISAEKCAHGAYYVFSCGHFLPFEGSFEFRVSFCGAIFDAELIKASPKKLPKFPLLYFSVLAN